MTEPVLPKPRALRLVRAPTTGTRARSLPTVPLPCGLTAWSDADDADIAILLALAPQGSEVPTLAEVVAQLPLPETLPDGTLVMVLGEVESKASLASRLERWLGSTKTRVPRALRTSALLAQGYERLGGGKDPAGHDLAWGYVRYRPSPAP